MSSSWILQIYVRREREMEHEKMKGEYQNKSVCQREGGGLCVQLGTHELFAHASVTAVAAFLRPSAEGLTFNL